MKKLTSKQKIGKIKRIIENAKINFIYAKINILKNKVLVSSPKPNSKKEIEILNKNFVTYALALEKIDQIVNNLSPNQKVCIEDVNEYKYMFKK